MTLRDFETKTQSERKERSEIAERLRCCKILNAFRMNESYKLGNNPESPQCNTRRYNYNSRSVHK